MGFLQFPGLVGGECIYHTQVALKREFFFSFFPFRFRLCEGLGMGAVWGGEGVKRGARRTELFMR